MRIRSLGTGSDGNAILVEACGSRVLVDAGFPPRELARRLRAVDVPPESIEALVVTHEHNDHARGAARAAARWGWTVYATDGTFMARPELRARPRLTVGMVSGDTAALSTMTLRTVRVSHDAAEPIAVVLTAQSGARAGIAYDLGHATQSLRSALTDLDVLVLESNHDEGWLRAGPYPPSVCQRIAGPRGHLSNRAAADLAVQCAHPRLAHVVLAHLSQRCNDAALALGVVRRALSRTQFRGTVTVAGADAPCAVSVATRDDTQLAFAW